MASTATLRLSRQKRGQRRPQSGHRWTVLLDGNDVGSMSNERAFEQAIEQKVSLEGRTETAVERVVRAVEALEREVNNGGYSQFFINPPVESAPDIVAALRQIDCPKTATAGG